MAEDALDHLTREELLALAAKHGVVLPEGYVTSFELRDLIKQAQAGAADPAEEPAASEGKAN